MATTPDTKGDTMSTIQTYIHKATAESLAAQLTENTGSHMLDSGGSNGRGWQRRAGMTANDFLAQSEVTLEDYGYVTVSLFHVLAAHLELTADSRHLTERFRAWVDDQPEYDAYYNSCGSIEEWLESIGVDDVTSENTYNYETLADGVIQYAGFNVGGVDYVAVSTHNGADVRGGYSAYVIYENCPCWEYALTRADIHCRMCNRSFDVSIGEITDSETGELVDNIGDKGECPKCRWPELVGGDIQQCGI